jgi:group I intron endonuclease
MNSLLEDKSQVLGHIYLITNTKTEKSYVGQTLTHRKNRGKYRPFGYMGRFQDHISEAICNTKKKQCTYLNNAIRMYGKDVFQCSLLLTCPKEDLDKQEEHFIKEYKSLYPDGYNLTRGGKVFKHMETDVDKISPLPPKKRGGCKSRSKETRAKMTERLKEVMGTQEAREEQMKRSQKQHSTVKLSKFKGVVVDMDNMEQYLRVRNSKDGSKFIKLVIGDKTTSFTGKYETLDEIKKKAIEFIKTIYSATLPNCSGNP